MGSHNSSIQYPTTLLSRRKYSQLQLNMSVRVIICLSLLMVVFAQTPGPPPQSRSRTRSSVPTKWLWCIPPGGTKGDWHEVTQNECWALWYSPDLSKLTDFCGPSDHSCYKGASMWTWHPFFGGKPYYCQKMPNDICPFLVDNCEQM